MRKMTLELNGTETDPSPPAVFERQVMRTGKPRIVMYVPDGRADLIHRLSALLPEPFHVLYVLHTPRGEGEPGRYQSPALRGVRDDKGHSPGMTGLWVIRSRYPTAHPVAAGR